MKYKIGLILMAVALFITSCTKDGGGENHLSVNPSEINVPAGLSTETIKVEADCRWTAEVNEEASAYVVLSKTKGTGNAEVNVRVMKNSYNQERTATVTFKAQNAPECIVNVRQAAADNGQDMKSAEFRIGTYNIRMSNLDKDADNIWSARLPRLISSIKDNVFDIFGVQEVSTQAQKDLKAAFDKDYTLAFFSPYWQNGQGDKAMGILFRTSKFTMSDWHYFWASENPDVCVSNDTGDKGNFNRGGCCAVFTHKETGMKFFMMCTHACLNADPNAKFAHVYIDIEKKYNPDGLPSFFVGDLNAVPSAAATATYKTWWKDAFADAETRDGAPNTYNGWSTQQGKSRIDYIYYRNNVKVSAYHCNNTLYNDLYASDHFPVSADVKISK